MICWSLLNVFGAYFALLGNFGCPFETLWVALGSLGALLGVTLASLWLPWVAGTIWGTLGSQAELGVILR